MPWEPLDHTADLGVVVSAGDRAELFAEAARALVDCMTEIDRVRPAERRAVRLRAPDGEQLLVGWLEEVLYRFDAEGFLTGTATAAIGERPGGGLELAGELVGEPFDAGRHPLKLLVKGVTYHALELAGSAAGWRARVIFDI